MRADKPQQAIEQLAGGVNAPLQHRTVWLTIDNSEKRAASGAAPSLARAIAAWRTALLGLRIDADRFGVNCWGRAGSRNSHTVTVTRA